MRIISITLLIFLSCVSFYAQDKKDGINPGFSLDFDVGCGNPAEESQLYTNREGKITKILNSSNVIFEQLIRDGNKEKGTFTVELIGIDSETNQTAIMNFLEKYVLNQNVEIIGNLRKKSDKKFKGLIFVASDDEDIDWINENLLEKGLAQYKSFESANLVPSSEPCQLQKAEERAKEAKLGIWAK